MPLYAGVPLVVPGDDTVPVWSEDVGTMTATWTDPTGTVWYLTDESDDRGFFTAQDIGGWGAQPYELVTDPHARGGEVVRSVRSMPSRLTWPLHVWGETHLQFVERYRALRRAFMMTLHKGQSGVLRISRPDGSYREIDAFYEQGFSGEPGENWLSANPVLTLFCPEGSWRGDVHVTEERYFSAPADFLSPFLTLSNSQVFGDTVIENPGELMSWPDWTITGPCTSVTATNSTLNQSWTITYTLLAGQTITVETGGPRPGVRGPGDVNLASSLNWPTAYLWGIAPGTNVVNFNVAGASAGAAIRLDYHPMYGGS